MPCVLVLVGCAGSSVTRSTPTDERNRQSAVSSTLDAAEARDRLLFEVDRWLGANYRYGGTDRSGFDCSGFVRRVVRDAFDTDLPRTTAQQMGEGTGVRRSDLQIGDLVFFRPSSRTDHVGLYLGDGEFAHASSSSGVMISHLGERYWANTYRMARRVLRIEHTEDPVGDASTARVTASEIRDQPKSERYESARVGW